MHFRSLAHNGSRLCFVAEKQAKNFELKNKINKHKPNIQLSLKPQ